MASYCTVEDLYSPDVPAGVPASVRAEALEIDPDAKEDGVIKIHWIEVRMALIQHYSKYIKEYLNLGDIQYDEVPAMVKEACICLCLARLSGFYNTAAGNMVNVAEKYNNRAQELLDRLKDGALLPRNENTYSTQRVPVFTADNFGSFGI